MTYSIAIIGLGLIGSSLALDLSQWAKKSCITGYDIDEETRKWSLQQGIVDRIAESLLQAIDGADFIFIATPVRAIPKIYSAIHTHLAPQAAVFDLGSTRQWIFDHLIPAPDKNLYCGFHPMGGGVDGGIYCAQPQLFKGRPILVTPFRPFKEGEINYIEEIASCMEGQVFFLTAQDHDQVCALLSHLPHVIANVYAAQVYQKEPCYSRFAGSSFRDFTRIAGSSPEVWLDIFLTNRDRIISALNELEEGLGRVKELIKTGNEDGLRAFLQQVKKLKEQVDEHDSL